MIGDLLPSPQSNPTSGTSSSPSSSSVVVEVASRGHRQTLPDGKPPEDAARAPAIACTALPRKRKGSLGTEGPLAESAHAASHASPTSLKQQRCEAEEIVIESSPGKGTKRKKQPTPQRPALVPHDPDPHCLDISVDPGSSEMRPKKPRLQELAAPAQVAVPLATAGVVALPLPLTVGTTEVAGMPKRKKPRTSVSHPVSTTAIVVDPLVPSATTQPLPLAVVAACPVQKPRDEHKTPTPSRKRKPEAPLDPSPAVAPSGPKKPKTHRLQLPVSRVWYGVVWLTHWSHALESHTHVNRSLLELSGCCVAVSLSSCTRWCRILQGSPCGPRRPNHMHELRCQWIFQTRSLATS